MDGIAIAVGVAIAVSGWIASGILARRSHRRQMRTEFLLSAYRRLDAASKRPLTSARREDLESALADIQLLGTAAHVALAQKFVTEFASSKEADTTAILRALRISLRRELLLDDVAPELKFLRVKEGDDWAEHSAFHGASATGALDGIVLPSSVASGWAGGTEDSRTAASTWLSSL